jgi:hypothetical protein
MSRFSRFVVFIVLSSASVIAQIDSTSVFKVVPTPSPNQPYPANNLLYSVSASSSSDIWAVGASAIHFDGIQWTGFSVPDMMGTGSSALAGVADVSPTDVWAAGYINYQLVNTFPAPIIEHFDGTSWTIAPSPQFPYEAFLRSIVAISPTDIWAGGDYFVDPSVFPLIEHYDGTGWSNLSPPVVNCSIWGMSADASDDVWAVGQTLGGGTCSLHYDGSVWQAIPTQNAGAAYNTLYGVVALTPDNVWAGGWYVSNPNDGRPQLTLIEHWDGVNWKIIPSPNIQPDTQVSSQLRGITAVSANDVWAFGTSINFASDWASTLVMRWNGSNWAIKPSPDVPLNNSLSDYLEGGTVLPGGDIWLVGSRNVFDTLVLNATGQ